jgi:hypothetical protein
MMDDIMDLFWIGISKKENLMDVIMNSFFMEISKKENFLFWIYFFRKITFFWKFFFSWNCIRNPKPNLI